MQVKIIPMDPVNDPLRHSETIPPEFEKYFLPNCERDIYYTCNYVYLEQRYITPDCTFCWLDLEVYHDCIAQPISDQPMLAILYMLNRSVKGYLAGYGPAPLRHGHAYLLYLPQAAAHEVRFVTGHLRVMYCALSNVFLNNLASEIASIGDLLNLFNTGARESLIEKPAEIGNKSTYQMWQVINFTETGALRNNHLKARCLDLINIYVSKAKSGECKLRKFNNDILHASEPICQAYEFINEHRLGKLHIRDVATHLNISEQKLQKGFKETFDISIGHYINKVKIQKVCEMIAEDKHTITQIADEMEYTDKGSLTRIFIKIMGITPSKYRNNLKRKGNQNG